MLVQAVFQNFTTLIDDPNKAGLNRDVIHLKKKRENLLAWYEKSLDWCNSENLLFDAFEIYFSYNADRIRKNLKEKVTTKINELNINSRKS